MKKAWLAICILASTHYVFAQKRDIEYSNARYKGALTEIKLCVVDDRGEVVTNASVRVVMDMPSGEYSQFGKTDTNGVYVARGITNGNYIEFLLGKNGYYGNRKKISFATMGKEHEVKDGKWQPYGAVERIELRKICNPAHLSVAFERNFNYTKAINAWVGFDLKKRDFVQPHGKGATADFEVFFDWDGKWFHDYTGMGERIRFTEAHSGYYQCATNADSEFKGPYSAVPDAEYTQDADFFERVIIDPNAYGRRYERKFFDKNKCWVVRSRCKEDDQGKLISAHYSVIYDIAFGCCKGGVACICVTCAFNPTPNDTNLEDATTAERSRHFIRQCEPPQTKKVKGKR